MVLELRWIRNKAKREVGTDVVDGDAAKLL